MQHCHAYRDDFEAIFKTAPGIKPQMWGDKKGFNEPTLLVIFYCTSCTLDRFIKTFFGRAGKPLLS